MRDKQDQDTPRDARRAERDAKRDMLDADKQDAYDATLAEIHERLTQRAAGRRLVRQAQLQETTED